MAAGLAKDTGLKEYLQGLYEGRVSREWYDRFREDLENADPWEVNHAIHTLLSGADDYPRLEQAVARFIRAAGKSLDKREAPEYPEDHPLAILTEENRILQDLRNEVAVAFKEYNALSPEDSQDHPAKNRLTRGLKRLSLLRTHYNRLQYTLFPALEKCGGEFGCLKLMWHIQDGILGELKETLKILEHPGPADGARINRLLGSFFLKSGSLIYREERILYPLAFRALGPAVLSRMAGELRADAGSPKGGSDPGVAGSDGAAGTSPVGNTPDTIPLSRGELNPGLIDLMLKNLPLDITLVDETGRVRYYSEGKERIFPRSPGIIGREVENCHPPSSVGVVKKIVEELKSGRREKAEFWIQREGRFIHIQYFPLFDHGVYRGIMEVSQDATALRSRVGERRLLDD